MAKDKPDAAPEKPDDKKPAEKKKTIYIGGNKFKGEVPKGKLPKGITIKK